jgi:hypothetical protein
MTQDNILLDKTIDFAIRMAKCYKYLMEVKNEYIMSKQMFRSGTSIGANIWPKIYLSFIIHHLSFSVCEKRI